MPTFKTCLVAAALVLPGCSDVTDLLSVTRAKAPSQLALPDGMVVAGAAGWCVDQAVSEARGDPAVVVLGSCAALDQDALSATPAVPGVVTVSVESEAAGSPSPEDLQAFFDTDAGRAALARDGATASVSILDSVAREDRLVLHTVDTSALPGAASDVWRALFDVEGRFISVSLYGLSDQPIPPEEGLATVDAQVDEILAANAR